MYLTTPTVEWIHTTEATIVACIFAAVSIVISIIHIMQHLSHYTMPGIQLYVIRILIICPVYAISSAMAVGLGKNGQYAEVARDVYEAFVIYSFLNLILEFCGGETDCVYQIENEPLLKMPCPLCFMKPKQRDARLIRTLKRGVLQFVIIKPIFAVIDIIMIATGEYYLLPYQFFEMFVYNISYTWALYCMYMFYVATNKIIKKFRPVLKFASVKLIVFATYYQSLFVKASSMSPENAIMWNDLLLCIEMVIFASILMLAYPTSEFQGGLPDSRLMNNVKDILKIKDVVQDVYHNFMPVYQEYTLQRSEKEAPETVRVKTYLAGNLDSVAIEMSHRYRGRNKRFAFNSLLRGDTPIRAQLRSRSSNFHGDTGGTDNIFLPVDKSDDDSECDDELTSDDENEKTVAKAAVTEEEILYEKFALKQKKSHVITNPLLKFRSESSEDELDTSSDCLTAGVRPSYNDLNDTDIEKGQALSHNKPNILLQQLNPIEMDIYRRRINFMRTHGIGMVVTDHGVEVRPSSYCPSEEEGVINVDFMNKEFHKFDDHFSVTNSLSYELPDENVSATVLPRITSSRKKGKEAKAHQKRVETAVRQEELLLQQAQGNDRKKVALPTASKSPSTSSENLASFAENFPPLSQDEDSCRNELSSDDLSSTLAQRKQQQQQQLDKMKKLPPITAISAPREKVKVLSQPRFLKQEGSTSPTQNSNVDTPPINKESRGASEESDDWGEFQFNDETEHISSESEVLNSAEENDVVDNITKSHGDDKTEKASVSESANDLNSNSTSVVGGDDVTEYVSRGGQDNNMDTDETIIDVESPS